MSITMCRYSENERSVLTTLSAGMLTALKTEAARYHLGVTTSKDLVRVAEASVLSGVESPSLILLAAETDPLMADVGPLFEKALEEVSIQIPKTDDACWVVIQYHLKRIANGEVGPRTGVQAILDEVYFPGKLFEHETEFVGDSHDIADLLGLFYGIDDILERPGEVSYCGKYGVEAIVAVEAQLHQHAIEWCAKHSA